MNKKTILIVLGIVILVALVAIGIFLNRPITAPVEGPSAPAQTETETPVEPCETCGGEAAETPTEGAAETPAELPAETPAAEIPEFSSCVLLDEEYCNKGEPIYYHGSYAPEYQGKLVSVGFNLPKGTKIYAPFDGFVGLGAMEASRVVFIDSPPFENTERFFIRDVESAIPENKFITMKDLGGRAEVKKGEVIGIVRGNTVNISSYGSEYSDKKYTVIIESLRGNAFEMSSFVPDSDLLLQYFNYLE